MRIRNVAVTVFAAFLAATGYSIKEIHIQIWIGDIGCGSFLQKGFPLTLLTVALRSPNCYCA